MITYLKTHLDLWIYIYHRPCVEAILILYIRYQFKHLASLHLDLGNFSWSATDLIIPITLLARIIF